MQVSKMGPIFTKQHEILVQSNVLKKDTKPYPATNAYTVGGKKYVVPGWFQNSESLRIAFEIYPEMQGIFYGSQSVDYNAWRLAKVTMYLTLLHRADQFIRIVIDFIGWKKIRNCMKYMNENKHSFPSSELISFAGDECNTKEDYFNYIADRIFPKEIRDVFAACANDVLKFTSEPETCGNDFFMQYHWCYMDRLQFDRIFDLEKNLLQFAGSSSMIFGLMDSLLKSQESIETEEEEQEEQEEDFDVSSVLESDFETPDEKSKTLENLTVAGEKMIEEVLKEFCFVVKLGIYDAFDASNTKDRSVYIS